jgi:DNA-binding response OmpR family regulator
MNERGKALLADDEELFRETTADLLRKAGYTCDCASDAAQAAQLICACCYDVLISDIKMPGNAALELVLQAKETAQGLPIILVTGYPTLQTAVRAVNLPVCAYLIKPIDFGDLLLLVQQCVIQRDLYRTAVQVQARLKLWDEEVAGLEAVLSQPLKQGVAEPARSLLATVFEGVAKSLTELRHVTECLAVADATMHPSETAALLDKLELTRHALRKTVRTLEESKNAFKSKRLGELRRQLQGLLGVLEQGRSSG